MASCSKHGFNITESKQSYHEADRRNIHLSELLPNLQPYAISAHR